MKLKNLCSDELRRQLYAVARSPWERTDPTKRAKVTNSFIIRNRLGEKVSKFVRAHATDYTKTTKVLRPREASEFTCKRAMELAGSDDALRPMRAVKQGLLELMTFHGMDDTRANELYTAFDQFSM